MLVCGFWVVLDASPNQRNIRIAYLGNSLSPAITLTASSLSALAEEEIVACLDSSELAPIRGSHWPAPDPRQSLRPSIVIIAVESLRHDVVHRVHQGREVMPHLNRLARGGLQWTRAYAQSTHSDYSDVCVLSSLYPLRARHHHYYRKSDPWPRTLIYDVLKPAGYRTAIFSSQNEGWGNMDEFLLTAGLDLLYDAQRSGEETHYSPRDPGLAREVGSGALGAGSMRDSTTMDAALPWVGRCVDSGEPFLLGMNLQSSHFPYDLPPQADRPFQPCELAADVTFLHYPAERVPEVKNAYYNALHECDRQLGRLVDLLEDGGQLDNTILVVLGENGEAFHENGLVTHAKHPYEPALHVATVMHAPRFLEPRVEDYPFEHVDLLPTLFGLAGWPSHPNFQGIDALSSARPPLQERLLFFHVVTSIARADAVTLAGRWKFMRDFDQHTTVLFDLASDPNELRDVSNKHPDLASQLGGVLETWRNRQLAYYQFPMYYQHHYPPRPPRLPSPALIAE